MKDNELLELAARAVGPKVVRKVECSSGFELVELSSGLSWNPLEDDGDALRLAVTLDIHIEQNTTFKRACALYYADYSVLRTEVFEPWGDDKMAATRRAIVRAAAEIGKSMQP